MLNRVFLQRELTKTIVLVVAFLTVVSSSLYASNSHPDDAVVVKFSIDWNALAEVSNSRELIDALHQNLNLEAASPLGFEVVVHMTGNVYQNREQQPHPVGSGIMVSLEEGEPATGLLREQRFNTYGGSGESETWEQFHESFKSALLYSMNSSGAFQEDDQGTVWLYVDDAVDGETVVKTGSSNMVLEISAEMLYRDGSKFGSKKPPEGFRQVLETVQLVLAPAEAPESTPVVQAAPETVAPVVEETAESGGITGVYGFDESGLKIEEKDGQYVMSDIRKTPPHYMPLTHIVDNRYSVDYNGMMVELKFSLDDQGKAFGMVVVQQGHEMKLPRK